MDRKLQLIGLNRFLTAIYRQEMRLSTLLEHLSFSPAQIAQVRADHLDDLVHMYLDLICARVLSMRDGPRHYDIPYRRFILEGASVVLLRDIGADYGISCEPVRQRWVKTLRRCPPKPHARNGSKP